MINKLRDLFEDFIDYFADIFLFICAAILFYVVKLTMIYLCIRLLIWNLFKI